MKEIYFYHRNCDDCCEITDKEFEEMMTTWMNKRDYWCKRIEVLFKEKSVAEVRTPPAEVGKQVFIDPVETEKGFYAHYYLLNGDYYPIGKRPLVEHRLLLQSVKQRLVPIEEYYNRQLPQLEKPSALKKIKK